MSSQAERNDDHCGDTFALIGVFTDPQKAKDAASHHEAEILLKTLNREDIEYF